MADKNMEAQISVEFEEATSRQSLNSGETINTLWSKVKRWLSDLKAVAFSGSYNDLSDKPTTATTDTDGLMSSSDKNKLDSVNDTYALKSLYGDTTINVGREAGSVVGEHSTAEGVNTTASGGASHAEGYSTVAIGDQSHTSGYYTKALHDNEAAYGKYNVSNDNTLFSIGDGTADDARHNAFEITTDGGKLHDKDIATTDLIPTSLPANGGNADHASYADNAGDASYADKAGKADSATNATNAGNADTVDGVHAWNMHTLAAGGGSHGSGNHLMYCKHNVLGNGKFYIGVTDGYDRAVAVNFAENADSVDDIHIHCVNDGVSGTSWFAVFAATNDIRAVDPARAYVGSSGGVTCSLIGTASGCQYSTILAWANAQATSTFASIVAATGFPSDAPYQQEALLQVQVDYYHQRKIVTWTRYLGGQAPQIRQRAIFGEAWNDDDWRVVCG